MFLCGSTSGDLVSRCNRICLSIATQLWDRCLRSGILQLGSANRCKTVLNDAASSIHFQSLLNTHIPRTPTHKHPNGHAATSPNAPHAPIYRKLPCPQNQCSHSMDRPHAHRYHGCFSPALSLMCLAPRFQQKYNIIQKTQDMLNATTPSTTSQKC